MELGFRKSSAAISEGKEERMENEDGSRKTTGKMKEGFKPQQKTERGGFRGFNTTKGKGRFGLLVLVMDRHGHMGLETSIAASR